MEEYRDSEKDMYLLFILIFQKYFYYKDVQINKSHTQINQMQSVYIYWPSTQLEEPFWKEAVQLHIADSTFTIKYILLQLSMKKN